MSERPEGPLMHAAEALNIITACAAWAAAAAAGQRLPPEKASAALRTARPSRHAPCCAEQRHLQQNSCRKFDGKKNKPTGAEHNSRTAAGRKALSLSWRWCFC